MRAITLRANACVLASTMMVSSVDAQGFGGSFDTAPSEAPAQTAPQPEAPSGDTFGGSFDGAGTGSQGSPVQSGDGSGFDGGSFETVEPGSNPERPEPVTPEPVEPDPNINIDPQIFAFESRDFGVPPQNQLRNGELHGATPIAIPGGAVVSTQDLATALSSGMQVVLIDVLGGEYTLPGAYSAPGLAQAGSFRDRNQQQAAQWLSQITANNPNTPIVIFCSDPQCWLSYNGALRTINAGYSAVYWYRGGLQAWQMAGLPMQPASY